MNIYIGYGCIAFAVIGAAGYILNPAARKTVPVAKFMLGILFFLAAGGYAVYGDYVTKNDKKVTSEIISGFRGVFVKQNTDFDTWSKTINKNLYGVVLPPADRDALELITRQAKDYCTSLDGLFGRASEISDNKTRKLLVDTSTLVQAHCSAGAEIYQDVYEILTLDGLNQSIGMKFTETMKSNEMERIAFQKDTLPKVVRGLKMAAKSMGLSEDLSTY